MTRHSIGPVNPPVTWTNWARTATSRPVRVERPGRVGEVVALVEAARRDGLRVKAVGAGHSFAPIAVTDGVLVELDVLSGVVAADPARGRVTFGAGTHLYDVPALLAPYGLALENMGDIDRQTLAGALSTGTHGTGASFRGLTSQLVGARLVTAAGDVLTVDETTNSELLPVIRLGLGALGLLVEVTLQCVPAFLLRAHEGRAGFDAVLDTLDERARADHFECFWFPGTDLMATKRNVRLPVDTAHRPPGRVGRFVDQQLVQNGALGAASRLGAWRPAIVPTTNRVASRLVGDRIYTDRSYAVFTSPRHVRFRETEYAVPREQLADAVRAVRRLITDQDWRTSFPVEVRVAAADDVWLSTAYGRDTGYVAVHRYWREEHEADFRAIDALMSDFDGRPHWGKLHGLTDHELRQRYPRFDDFVAVRDRLDPDRLFGNAYLDRVLGP